MFFSSLKNRKVLFGLSFFVFSWNGCSSGWLHASISSELERVTPVLVTPLDTMMSAMVRIPFVFCVIYVRMFEFEIGKMSTKKPPGAGNIGAGGVRKLVFVRNRGRKRARRSLRKMIFGGED